MEEKFTYSYKAPTESERKEIMSIKRQYEQDKNSDKLERLRYLHSKVKNVSTVAALSLGIVGTLVLGGGMALVLELEQMVVGSVIGILGIIILSSAYPVYNLIFKKLKKKHSEEILKLSNELLG